MLTQKVLSLKEFTSKRRLNACVLHKKKQQPRFTISVNYYLERKSFNKISNKSRRGNVASGFVDEQQWTTVQERAFRRNEWRTRWLRISLSLRKRFYCKNKIFHNSDINNLKQSISKKVSTFYQLNVCVYINAITSFSWTFWGDEYFELKQNIIMLSWMYKMLSANQNRKKMNHVDKIK